MAGKGGRRPGAGRPRKEDAKRRQPGPVRLAEEAYREALPDLAKVALALALAGNERMLIYCTNRALGAPTQPIELEVRRAAEKIAAQTGADPEWLVKRAQEIAAEATGVAS